VINRNSLLVLATLIALAATSMSGVRAQAVTTVSFDRPVSASVFASWLTRGNRLALLVLWRGSPGWFWRADSGASGGGGTIEQFSHTIREGGLTFRIDYDFARNTAVIAGQELSLTSTNVVLADYVDSPAGATIVGTRYVNPDFPSSSDWTDAAIVTIQREPELFDYLQCHVALPQSSDRLAEMKQGLVTKLCDLMRPR
jgi:hypothetical protein